jgi:YD repeat-containing protein
VYAYDVLDGDTVLRTAYSLRCDAADRPVEESLREYLLKDKKPELSKEMSFRYDSVSRTSEMTENIYGGKTERGKIQRVFYRDYAKGQALIVRNYDVQGVLLNEDSMRYDRKGRAAEKFTYLYTGSTGKFSERYRYDRRGRVKKRSIYFYWFSVKASGKYIEKKQLTKCYRYRRDAEGRPTGIRYREYRRTKGRETIRYDEAGRRTFRQAVVRTTTRNKETKKREKTVKTTIVKWQEGLMADSLVVQNGKTIFAMASVRELHGDTAVWKMLAETQGQLTKRSEMAFFPAPNGRLVRETLEDIRDGKRYQILYIRYDEKGNTVQKTGFLNNKKIYDEQYEFTYDEQQRVLSKKTVLFQVPKYTVRFTYDDRGRLVKEEKTDASGKTVGFVLYGY